MPSTRFTLLLLLVTLHVCLCHAFAKVRPPFSVGSVIARTLTSPDDAIIKHRNHPLINLRGGGSVETSLHASPGDYSEAARALFGNYITPATLLLTALVPLSLQEIKVPQYGKNAFKKKLRGLYYVIGLLATCSELICVIYASIASNKLLQTASKPAASAYALIQRDYELAWIATTIHFIGGLLGFMACSGIGAFLVYPPGYNTAGACFAAAALLWMLRLANTRAAMFQHTHLSNCFSLLKRYLVLTTKQLKTSSGPNVLGMASIALTGVSICLLIRALVSEHDE